MNPTTLFVKIAVLKNPILVIFAAVFPIAKLFKYIGVNSFILSIICLLFLILLILVDIISGLIASWHEKKPFNSKQGLYAVYKIGFYTIFYGFLLILEVLLNMASPDLKLLELGKGFSIGALTAIRLTLFILASGWEWYSIGENTERRFGFKPKIFIFPERVIQAIELRIIRKIEDSPTTREQVYGTEKDKDNEH